jgi:hypothetical protein
VDVESGNGNCKKKKKAGPLTFVEARRTVAMMREVNEDGLEKVKDRRGIEEKGGNGTNG